MATTYKNYNAHQEKLTTEICEEIIKDDKYLKLVSANTGTGKTFTFIKTIPKIHKGKKIIVLTSNVSNAKQEGRKENCTSCTGNSKLSKALKGNKRFIFATINKVKQLVKSGLLDPHKYIIVFDEAHISATSADFRGDVIRDYYKLLDTYKFFMVFEITATIETLDPKRYDCIYKIETEQVIDFEVYIIECKEIAMQIELVKQVNKLLDRKEKFIAFQNTSKNLNRFFSKKHNGLVSLDSENKADDETMKSILEKEVVPPTVLGVLATDIMSQGVNIKNNDYNTYIFYNEKCPTTIKQASNRCRDITIKTKTIYYICKEIKHGKERTIESIRSEVERQAQTKLKGFKTEQKQGFNQYLIGVDKKTGLFEDYFHYDFDTNIISIDKVNLDHYIYKTWISQLNTESLFKGLKNYEIKYASSCFEDAKGVKMFDDLEDLKDYKELKKEEKKENKELKEAHTLELLEVVERSEELLNSLKSNVTSNPMISRYEKYINTSLGDEFLLELSKDKELFDRFGYSILRHLVSSHYNILSKQLKIPKLVNNIIKKTATGDKIEPKEIGKKKFKGFKSSDVMKYLKLEYDVKRTRGKGKDKHYVLGNKKDNGFVSAQTMKELCKLEVTRMKK